MKKIILVSAALLLQALCFAAEFRLTNESKGYDGEGMYSCIVPKDARVGLSSFRIFNVRKYPWFVSNLVFDFDFGIYVKYKNEEVIVDANLLIPTETEELFDDNIIYYKLKENGKYWTTLTELDILKSNTRNTYYRINKKSIDYSESQRGIYDGPWYEGVSFIEKRITNLFMSLSDNKKYYYLYLIKKIVKNKNGYDVTCELADSDIEDSDYVNDTLEKLKNQTDIILNLIIDGDYLYFNTENNELLFTYILVDRAFAEQYENLIRTNKCDLSKINWPRHADGTCDYEDANNNATASASGNSDTSTEEATLSEAVIFRSAPIVGKTATVTENLRLRTDDKTTAEVVTTLAAGTRVKVLAHGREDTIDGIASNWVQVEVLGGAKDKDGNAIEAGTVGWLFGGYLSEVESTESENPNEKAANAKESSALPIVPIAASVVALAVLLAVVILVAKKRKSSKD
ncbi:MAG: SH3 domain-containing protein [Treponema sp.]|nr:SH3 domain-containing protein [Treponema sp.]